jgi:hypothetical protein
MDPPNTHRADRISERFVFEVPLAFHCLGIVILAQNVFI